MTKITLELPGGIDPAVAQRAVDAAIAELEKKSDEEREHERILEDDDAFAEYASTFDVPIVRANTYKRANSFFPLSNEIQGWWSSDSRRPVVMRGSVYSMIRRHSNSLSSWCPNGLCQDVVDRYLRMTKYTAFDQSTHYDHVSELLRRMRDKHPGTSYHLTNSIRRIDNDGIDAAAYVNGKYRYLTVGQFTYIKTMYKIIEKTDKLEDRHKMVVEWRSNEPEPLDHSTSLSL